MDKTSSSPMRRARLSERKSSRPSSGEPQDFHVTCELSRPPIFGPLLYRRGATRFDALMLAMPIPVEGLNDFACKTNMYRGSAIGAWSDSG